MLLSIQHTKKRTFQLFQLYSHLFNAIALTVVMLLSYPLMAMEAPKNEVPLQHKIDVALSTLIGIGIPRDITEEVRRFTITSFNRDFMMETIEKSGKLIDGLQALKERQAFRYYSPDFIAHIIRESSRSESEISYAVPTLIYFADIKSEPKQEVEILLRAGANPNAYEDINYRVGQSLARASAKGFSECVSLLLQYGAHPNTQESFGGRYPLTSAAANENADIVRKLIDAGADPSMEDANGKSAFDYAMQANNHTIIQILSESKSNVSTLKNAVLQRDHNAVTTMILLQEVHARDIEAVLTALDLKDIDGQILRQLLSQLDDDAAAQLFKHSIRHYHEKGRFEIYKQFILIRPSVLSHCGFRNKTLLHFLARLHYVHTRSLTKLLIMSGVPVDTLDSDGNTALHLALEIGNTQVARPLIKSRSCLDTISGKGHTPLMIVASISNGSYGVYSKKTIVHDMTRALLRAGANKELRDSHGNTALDIALKNNNLAAAVLLGYIQKD